MRRVARIVALCVLAGGLLIGARELRSRTAVTNDFTHFESGHVHPAALTPNGNRLLVVNTPDNRLSVFDLTGATPQRIAEIPVGLEPVSVAALDDNTAWVVDQLSDDVSIVDLVTLNVKATLKVGDEPSDVVFAGSPLAAYVSVSQEDRVRVYDPANLAAAPTDIPIDGRMPRALARDAAGTRVLVSVFHGGNRTSVLSESEVPNDSLPSDPEFPRDPGLPVRPQTGLMVKQDPDGSWRDMYGKLWNYRIKYSLREVDVAEISTATRTVTRGFGDLGTVNFGLAVSPLDGTIAGTATEALNVLRLEPRLRGHMVDTQIGFVSLAGAETVRNLNPHVNYAVPTGTQAERDSALGIPTGVAWSSNGQRCYVTSLASDRLGVIDPNGAPGAAVLARIPTVAGPTGVVVDDARGRVYVVGRFHNQLQTLSTAGFGQVSLTSIGFDPTPDPIVNGRRFFYGGFTSGHGDQACATCHVFGDMDNLAWDLGDPNGEFQARPPGQVDPFLEGFDPEKGPMVTQSLRGLPGTGLLHWRGDRANLFAFNPAFVGLMGRTGVLPDSEMTAFAAFVDPLVYPPNPAQNLDRTMPDAPPGQPSARRGELFFMSTTVDGGTCNNCHTVPTGTNGQVIDDAALLEDQDVKIPQLRNLYKKTGFADVPGAVNKRGFGFTHDGAIDNLFNFLKFPGFNFGPTPAVQDANRRDVESFLLAFDTGTAPSIGRRITFDGTNNSNPTLVARMDSLANQFAAGNCDVIAKGRVGGIARGWVLVSGNQWLSDDSNEDPIVAAQLRALAGPGSEITVSGVPFGSGVRMGVDRDRDNAFDGDERLAGSDPSDPRSTPGHTGVPAAVAGGFGLRSVRPNPFRTATEVSFTLARAGRVDLSVYDVLGREVRAVSRGQRFEAGLQSLRWDGRAADGSSAAAGLYFVRLDTEGGRWTRPVVRVR